MLKIAENEFVAVIDEMCECSSCELSVNRTQVVPYRGDPRTDVMVIAEAPGKEEDIAGKAMVGRSGSYLVSLFKENALDITDIYITNTVMCRPLNNADPTGHQLDCCSRWLIKHINMVDPKYIIAVGRISASRLLPEIAGPGFKITQAEGQFLKSAAYDNRLIIPLRHPSAILRNPTRKDSYENAVRYIVSKILSDLKK